MPRELFRIFVGGSISKVMLITAEYDDHFHGLHLRFQNSDYIRSDLFALGETGPLVAIYAFADPIPNIRQYIYNEAKDLRSFIVTHGDCHVGVNAFLRVREPIPFNAADLNRLSQGFYALVAKLYGKSKLQQRQFQKALAGK